MQFDLSAIEQMCLDMYRDSKDPKNDDPMKGLFLMQSLSGIHKSVNLSSMFYGFYDGSGI